MAAPTVTTQAVLDARTTTAIGSGNVTSDGAQTISERGVVVGTSANPTTSNTKFTVTGTTGAFNAALSSLVGATIYHARAYAINAGGTSYGADVQFQTQAVLTDATKHAATVVNQAKH